MPQLLRQQGRRPVSREQARVVRQAPGTHYAYAITSLSELAEYAHETRLEVSSLRTVAVAGEQARLLECEDGARWHQVGGVRYRQSDGVALGVTEIFLRDWYPGVQEHLRHLDEAMHVMLARHYGVTVDEVKAKTAAKLDVSAVK